ncbi:hypothetical protein LTR64_007079 [Lithohypha guttulata]|uniref:Uncharacterized protein n=1 Tax=Lithohypha guttulata TaxID=1690604 RepID=A0AAN7T5W0_9EURO|nr:hypothetical protein LTR51_004365 [Lithohypha guttulata]KAK5090973.1 hypothetical protein LTR05_001151 [Lithohypha guttulata]
MPGIHPRHGSLRFRGLASLREMRRQFCRSRRRARLPELEARLSHYNVHYLHPISRYTANAGTPRRVDDEEILDSGRSYEIVRRDGRIFQRPIIIRNTPPLIRPPRWISRVITALPEGVEEEFLREGVLRRWQRIVGVLTNDDGLIQHFERDEEDMSRWKSWCDDSEDDSPGESDITNGSDTETDEQQDHNQ